MSLTPGARLGVYEIVGLIGAGGMGEVYRARDGRLNRDVALLTLTPNGVRVGEPQPLFDLRTGRSGYPYAASADGKRFLITSFDQATSEPISVMMNWLEGRTR